MGELILILTMGLPRSGKSTWVKKQGYPIVNPDSIRLALHGQRYQSLAEPMVWAIAKIMVTALFVAGHETVIVDATNNSKKRRDFWLNEMWKVKVKEINTPKDECIRRAILMDDAEIIPIIEKMNLEKEPLFEEEDLYY